MAKKYVNPNLTLLLNCTSSDESRFHLTGIHFTGDKYVATDGHRMAVVNASAINNPHGLAPNSTYERGAFALYALKPIECKYPNWQQLLPDTRQSEYAFKIIVPKWMEMIKPARRGRAPAIGIDENGQFTTGKALVYLNMAYIRELADVEVWVYIKDPLSPIVISPAVKDPDWQLVVMPLRGEARPVVHAIIARPPTVAGNPSDSECATERREK